MMKSAKMPPGSSAKPERPPQRAVNRKLTSQTRKVMGKHYAAKYGVRKERGRG
ncbi:MAG: hypothetical protein RBS99_11770 [Rhodospirillales bacterium]|nr:hypothetical protein [Rhodospirillales bacterium]